MVHCCISVAAELEQRCSRTTPGQQQRSSSISSSSSTAAAAAASATAAATAAAAAYLYSAAAGGVSALGFSDDGNWIASYSVAESAVRLWHLSGSGFLGGIWGNSSKSSGLLQLPRLPSNILWQSPLHIMKTVSLYHREKSLWVLTRENGVSYELTTA
ncbi:hypothetical protein, conserved [Eimeria acervulina]|uniref:Uncharacterized protein n=1 Tax=Eimeria acervulina TaxID=5801 RepID=U6GI39_EIMAC|nr:hypothetical protein, conserved [Eimeria acervulina]CDI79835.1 hypothetical protein, conserved [Eimeria acervulina]